MSDTSPLGRKFQTLFERAELAVALVRASDRSQFVSASKGFIDRIGAAGGALVGQPVESVFAKTGRETLAAAIHRCQTTLAPVRAGAVRRQGARVQRFNLVIHPAHGVPGHVVILLEQGVLSLADELRRAAPFQLPPSAHDRSLIFLHHPKSDRARFADSGLADSIGLSGPGGERFQRFADRIHFEDRPLWERAQARLSQLPNDGVAAATVRIADDRGGWRLVHVRSRIVRRDRAGGVRLVLGTVADITDYAAAAVDAAGLAAHQVEENERVRIGRELHDSTSQYLVAADLGVAQVLRSGNLSAEDRACLMDVQEQLVCAKGEIRSFAHFLQPAHLAEFRLRRTMEKFCAGFARRSGLHIRFAFSGQLDDVPPDVEHALFRVGQEALMNVYRHASAHEVHVELTRKGDSLTLEVRDDGVGIRTSDPLVHEGIGITIIRSRMHGVGGDVALRPLSPGLAVVARVPLLRQKRADRGKESRSPRGRTAARPRDDRLRS